MNKKEFYAVVFYGDRQLYDDIKSMITVDNGKIIRATRSKNPIFFVSWRKWKLVKYIK